MRSCGWVNLRRNRFRLDRTSMLCALIAAERTILLSGALCEVAPTDALHSFLLARPCTLFACSLGSFLGCSSLRRHQRRSSPFLFRHSLLLCFYLYHHTGQ